MAKIMNNFFLFFTCFGYNRSPYWTSDTQKFKCVKSKQRLVSLKNHRVETKTNTLNKPNAKTQMYTSSADGVPQLFPTEVFCRISATFPCGFCVCFAHSTPVFPYAREHCARIRGERYHPQLPSPPPSHFWCDCP